VPQICVGAPFSTNTFTASCVIVAVLLLGRAATPVIDPLPPFMPIQSQCLLLRGDGRSTVRSPDGGTA